MFYIDVGNVAPNDIESYMQKVMTQMKRHQIVDESTGKIDLRYNPLSIEELQFEAITPGNLDFADLRTAAISGALNLCSKYQNPNVSSGSDSP